MLRGFSWKQGASMTLALLLALLGSLVAMGVIVRRLENNG